MAGENTLSFSLILGNLFGNSTTAGAASSDVAGTPNPALDLNRVTVTVTNTGDQSRTGAPRNEIVVYSDRPLPTAFLRELRALMPSQVGTIRFVTAPPPSLAASTGEIPVTDLKALQTLFTDPGALLSALQSTTPAAADVLSLGLHAALTGEVSHAATGQLLSLFRAPENRGNASKTSEDHASRGFEQTTASRPSASAGLQQDVAAPRASINVEATRIPEAVKQVLVQLNLVPPGVSTEQAMGRFQEVARLWFSGATQHSDLSPAEARVVTTILQSVALVVAGNVSSAQIPGRGVQASETLAFSQVFSGGPRSDTGAWISNAAGRADFRFAPTANQIAKAVLGAFPEAAAILQPTLGRSAAPGQGGEASHSSSAPQAAPGQTQAHKPAGEKDPAIVRLTDAVRTEIGLDRTARGDAKGQTRISGDENRERTDASDVELKDRREAHDQESQSGSGELEATSEIEALWQELHAALERAGFVAPSGTLRPLLDAVEGRSFLRLVAAKVPVGLDLLDVLGLIDSRMGLSAESGAVNAALHRLAGYRSQWKSDKVRAVLEPLHDAYVVLDMIESDLMPVSESEISAEDLKGFETHAAAAQFLLDNPTWLSHMGADAEDRGDLERTVPDVERLLANAEEKFQLLALNGPEYFSQPAPALPH